MMSAIQNTSSRQRLSCRTIMRDSDFWLTDMCSSCFALGDGPLQKREDMQRKSCKQQEAVPRLQT